MPLIKHKIKSKAFQLQKKLENKSPVHLVETKETNGIVRKQKRK